MELYLLGRGYTCASIRSRKKVHNFVSIKTIPSLDKNNSFLFHKFEPADSNSQIPCLGVQTCFQIRKRQMSNFPTRSEDLTIYHIITIFFCIIGSIVLAANIYIYIHGVSQKT